MFNTIWNGILPTVEFNTDLSFTGDEVIPPVTLGQVTVNFADVWLDSVNITNPAAEASWTTESSYYVLYPSSGGLYGTDVNVSTSTYYQNISLHNGACRSFWGASHYGYFEHNPNTMPTPFEHTKKVKSNQNEQSSFELREQNGLTIDGYSTIDELKSVFSTESLDLFETYFLDFCEDVNPNKVSDGNISTFTSLIKQLFVVEESWVRPYINEVNTDAQKLAKGQMDKTNFWFRKFLTQSVAYKHGSINNFDSVYNGSTLYQKIIELAKPSQDSQYDFGAFINSPLMPGALGFLGSQVEQDIKIYVGEYHLDNFIGPTPSQFNTLISPTMGNPIYQFFSSVRDIGIELNSDNVKSFSPLIRMYATYTTTPAGAGVTAQQWLQTVIIPMMGTQSNLQTNYVDRVLAQNRLQIGGLKSVDTDIDATALADGRGRIDNDDLKLETYRVFKTFNDRWIAGYGLSEDRDKTLFEQFLFYDRANKDIGSEAVIDIFDLTGIDSSLDTQKNKTLSQSVASFLSTILANNYFNFIPLPSYINFYNVGGDNAQEQANAMWQAFRTVDYTNSAPAFLCQYVGPPSTSLDVRTKENAFNNDTFNLLSPARNGVIGKSAQTDEERKKSNKVMAFTVDFGIPNQNIFESVSLDQSEFKDTSESFKITQALADSGGDRPVVAVGQNLYNIYQARSYKVNVTCVGNVMVQPTMYFQLRYLPMFNGPYLIMNVEHNIKPNTIETSFEGMRVPLPKLPLITDLVAKINQDMVERFKKKKVDIDKILPYLDSLDVTPKFEENGGIDFELTIGDVTGNTVTALNDPVEFKDPVVSSEVKLASSAEARNKHLGVDIQPRPTDLDKAIAGNMGVYAGMSGKVKSIKNGCGNGDMGNECVPYGNYVEIFTTVNVTANEPGTTIGYTTIYAFLDRVEVAVGDVISKSEAGSGNKIIGYLGNSGPSDDYHLHYEVRRHFVGENLQEKVQTLNAVNFLPSFIQLSNNS